MWRPGGTTALSITGGEGTAELLWWRAAAFGSGVNADVVAHAEDDFMLTEEKENGFTPSDL